MVGDLFVAVEKEQPDYQRNRRLSAIDLSRGALKPGAGKDKVLRSYLLNYYSDNPGRKLNFSSR